MLQAFYNEEAVAVGGDTYRLVIDFAAIDAVESLLGRSFGDVVNEVLKPNAPVSLIGKVVWGLLRRHHPELTIDQVASLLFGEPGVAVGAAVGKLIEAAFNLAPATEEKEKGKNPRKPRGASKTS